MPVHRNRSCPHSPKFPATHTYRSEATNKDIAKAIDMAGYLRANIHQFPALSRFHHQIELEMAICQRFFHELEEMAWQGEVLGVLSPLIPYGP